MTATARSITSLIYYVMCPDLATTSAAALDFPFPLSPPSSILDLALPPVPRLPYRLLSLSSISPSIPSWRGGSWQLSLSFPWRRPRRRTIIIVWIFHLCVDDRPPPPLAVLLRYVEQRLFRAIEWAACKFPRNSTQRFSPLRTLIYLFLNSCCDFLFFCLWHSSLILPLY